ncbi:hypothetical protein ACGF12_23810 [Kitasatospora sp. NPDC048296]|uniref:hypothetical protein n=1 Tax=Kitasatospora sp. NPDC048296 TaxID=3364048 RepID=UPI003715F0E1
MTPALDTTPRTELTETQASRVDDRPSLADFAQLGAEELYATIRRALPDAGVPVAAFNSCI